MRRNIKKDIATFRKRYSGTREGGFSIDDFQQIFEIAEDMDPRDLRYNLVGNALMAGFMIGYRKAQADQRKKKKGGRGNA